MADDNVIEFYAIKVTYRRPDGSHYIVWHKAGGRALDFGDAKIYAKKSSANKAYALHYKNPPPHTEQVKAEVIRFYAIEASKVEAHEKADV